MTKKIGRIKKKTVLQNNLIPKKVPPKNIIISLALVKHCSLYLRRTNLKSQGVNQSGKIWLNNPLLLAHKMDIEMNTCCNVLESNHY